MLEIQNYEMGPSLSLMAQNFNGPKPTSKVCDTEEDEMELVALWLNERIEDGIAPNEITVLVRSENQLERAFAAIDQANLSHKQLDHNFQTKTGSVTVSPMHLAKGLEFRIVVAMACDDEVIPLQEKVESIVGEVDLEEVLQYRETSAICSLYPSKRLSISNWCQSCFRIRG